MTNNECSEAEATELTKRGYHPGDKEWEQHGICQAITWPRSKYSIYGKRSDGSLLKGNYYLSRSEEKLEKRNYKQISFVSPTQLDTTSKKKQLVSLLGKEVIPQSLVTNNCKFVVPNEEKYSSSILFDPSAIDEYLLTLEDHDFIQNIYIVTDKASVFKKTKEQIHELLGDYVAFERIKIPVADGFKANAAYFKLGFLHKTSVELGRQFKEMLPTLWMKAGAHGRCPEMDGEEIPAMLVLPENKFAILTEESSFPEFEETVNAIPEIETVYIVTDYETGYIAMTKSLNAPNTYQLYRDYLDNFRINTGRN